LPSFSKTALIGAKTGMVERAAAAQLSRSNSDGTSSIVN
jgi:hypothetical protein